MPEQPLTVIPLLVLVGQVEELIPFGGDAKNCKVLLVNKAPVNGELITERSAEYPANADILPAPDIDALPEIELPATIIAPLLYIYIIPDYWLDLPFELEELPYPTLGFPSCIVGEL